MEIWVVNENEDRVQGRGPSSETGVYTDLDFAVAAIHGKGHDGEGSGVSIHRVEADTIHDAARLGLAGTRVWGEYTDILGNLHHGPLDGKPAPRLGPNDLERLRELDARYGQMWRDEEARALEERFAAASRRAAGAPREHSMLLAYHGTGPGHPVPMLAGVFTNKHDADHAIRKWRQTHVEEPLITLFRGTFNVPFARRAVARSKPLWREVESDFAEYRRLLKRAGLT